MVAERCFPCASERVKFLSEWNKDYVIPICQSFSCGITPPIAPSWKFAIPSEPGATEKTAQTSSKPLIKDDITSAFGKLFKLVPESQLLKLVSEIAPAMILAMLERNPSGILLRLGGLLDAIGDTSRESFVISETVSAAMSLDDPSNVPKSCRVAAFVLSRGAASIITNASNDSEGKDLSSFIDRVDKFVLNALRLVAENESSSDKLNEISKDAASLFSWVIWSSQFQHRERDVTQRTLGELNDILPPDEIFVVVFNIVEAHKQRRSLGAFSPCNPLEGRTLERMVETAITNLELGQAMPSSAISFLSAMTNGEGGAALSPEVLRKVVSALSSFLTQDPKCEDLDPLILSLLTTLAQHLDQYLDDFDELALASFFRTAFSEQILTLILYQVSLVTAVRAVTFVERLMRNIIIRCDEDPDLTICTEIGTVFAKVALALREQDAVSSVDVFSKFVHTASSISVREFLDDAPFQVVFGDGCHRKVNVESLLEVLQNAYDYRVSEVFPHLQLFCDALDKQSLSTVSAKVTDVALHSPNSFVLEILGFLCSVDDGKTTEDAASLSAIAGKIDEHLSVVKPASNMDSLKEIPRLIELCVIDSNGKFVESAKGLLTNATNMIRRDPAAPLGLLALDIMSSSLRYHVNSVSREIVGWWQDLLSLVLRTIRRCLEQPRGLAKADIEKFETHCACYIYHCVKGTGMSGVNSDDVRFWVLRTWDTLEKVVQRLDAEGEAAIAAGHERLAWIYNVGFTLIDYIDDNDEKRTILADQISHWGAWSGIYCVPTIEPLPVDSSQECSSTPRDWESVFTSAGAEGWASLTIQAAERGFFLVGAERLKLMRLMCIHLFHGFRCQAM